LKKKKNIKIKKEMMTMTTAHKPSSEIHSKTVLNRED